MPAWETYLTDHATAYQEELLEFLCIPSVSALPAHAADVRRAGEWVENRLALAGVEEVRMLETGGHPVVYGEWLHAAGKPTVLIYGHFDTQPADPLGLWNSPPFEPVIRDGRVYARGASDDKGNMLVPILAVEAMLKTTGSLPINVKFLFEGQEEIGSPQLPTFLAAHRELFACDLVLSADGGQEGEEQPSIGVACKGLAGVQIDVKGASTDLHSGVFGGAVANPIHALVHLIDTMRTPEGKILVDGFYDAVVPLSEGDRAHIAAVPFDETAYKGRLGIDALVGEPGYTAAEQLGARPTLEVNGIWGGFQGAGTKTVLPSEAHAKITCRLVPNQDPAAIADLLAAHVRRHVAPGVTATVSRLPGQAKPYAIPADHWGNQAAAEVLAEVYGKKPYYTRTGGSIPVCELFQESLGAYTVSFAFGLMDEQIHAPNEFYRLASFTRGRVAYCKLLDYLGAK
ncbi:MAG TPA: dipeptidase [Chloroflexota bacterium]|nr:dipeptidase [Chloroflexota bacterium]